MASIEEKVEEHYKAILDTLNIRHFGKTEGINDSITKALREFNSKSGGSGMEGEENFVGDSEIIALGGASNETKDRPLG